MHKEVIIQVLNDMLFKLFVDFVSRYIRGEAGSGLCDLLYVVLKTLFTFEITIQPIKDSISASC